MKLREANDFSWFPIQEVGKLFAGIFITIIPAIAILRAGESGALKSIIESVSSGGNPVNYMYFWATGILSSFLDNAPTYLVFFNTAGGDAAKLMGDMPNTLLAISAGAVFMGANTYIGNAPNFMVKSIAEQSGIKMPSFFGYMLKYSIPVLIPIFILVSLIFF
jgi:Na+/H+ antiporter NhaD/arsenite permease-like protein